MKFVNAFVFLFALAKLADAEGDDQAPKLRGLATTRSKTTWYVNSYDEHLGKCNGAVCGLWGDPHILSCDGLGYDCNARGLFTLMKNSLYNIQGHFIHVNSEEMGKLLKWGKYPTATYTTDIAIDNLQANVPTMQFSFPEFITEDGLPPSETGCLVNFVYDTLLIGTGKTEEVDVEACRIRCEGKEGCTKFTYSDNRHCSLAGKDQKIIKKPKKWSRTVSGPVDKCGHPTKWEARGDSEDLENAKVLGNGSGNKKMHHYNGEGCPILYYEDGALKNISTIADNEGYLYGGNTTETYAQLDGRNKIKIVTKNGSDSVSEIMLEVAGDGPGELFGCHWNLFVCLPNAERITFEEQTGGQGLFGSPDGNPSNDWTDVDGDELTLPTNNNDKNTGTRGKEAFEYCTNNWCVGQEDSIMVPPPGASYDDLKCFEEEYVDYDVDNEHCRLSAEQIAEECKDSPSLLLAACQLDCCLTRCNFIDEVIQEITDMVTFSEKEEDPVIGFREDPETAICDGDAYDDTGETVCPTASGSVVKVLHETAAIPDGEPIIYGISFGDSLDDNHGREVSFRVGNPFGSNADLFVRYEKKVGQFANDPACDKLLDTSPGCQVEAPEISVGCIEYPNTEPFAIVDVYFASGDLSSDGETEVEKCCHPPEYSGVGVIKYSFKIQCGCPDDQVE